MATLGEFLGSGASTTKLLLHLNNSSTDSSGNGNNGSDTSITYVDGKFGKCASFNRAAPSYITLSGSGSSLSFSGDFTLMAWVNLASTNQGGTIISKATSNGASSNNYEFLCFNNAVQLAGVLGKYASSPTTTDLVTSNSWHHVVVVKTGTGTVAIYLDGNPLSVSYPAGAVTFNTNSTQAYIGRRDDGAGNGYWSGLLDEIIAEPRAWSAEEVKKYYTYAKGRFGII